jgi:hypothetical protein
MSAPAAPPVPINRPSRAERLLGLVRRLLDYGRELASTLHQRAAADLVSVACNFGTRDLALIIASITRGLLRACALEARLERSATRLDAEPRRRDQPAQHKPRTHQPAAAATPRRTDLALEEQIAAEVRGRPIGVVIADICRDLGIVASHPLWRDITLAIILEGGKLVPVLRNISHRVHQIFAPEEAAAPPAWPAPSPAPASTGPP